MAFAGLVVPQVPVWFARVGVGNAGTLAHVEPVGSVNVTCVLLTRVQLPTFAGNVPLVPAFNVIVLLTT